MNYQYSITGDITSQKVDVPRLTQEIGALAIAGFEGLKVDRSADSLIVVFENPISGPDKTALDTTVQNTSGDPLPMFDCCGVPVWDDSATLPANHPPAIVFCTLQGAYFTSDGSVWSQL